MRARWVTGVHHEDGCDLPGGTAGPGTRLGLPTPVSSWDHHTSRLVSLCQVYFNSRVLAARNNPVLRIYPTQSAPWPGLSVLPKLGRSYQGWVRSMDLAFQGCEMLETPRCPRSDRAGGAASPALCRPSHEWTRLGGSVPAGQMLSWSHPRPTKRTDRKLENSRNRTIIKKTRGGGSHPAADSPALLCFTPRHTGRTSYGRVFQPNYF